MSESALVLVVEDEYFLQAYVEQILNDTGFAAESAFSGEEALTLFNSGFQKFKAVITDIRLGGRMNGWEVALRIREKEAAFPVIYITAQARRNGSRKEFRKAFSYPSRLRQPN